MSFAAVQKHVAVLERAGLVSKERHGREQLVRTDREAVRRARQVLDQLERDLARAGRADVRPARAGPRPGQTCERTRQMSVTSIDKDVDNLTVTLIADFDAPAERVWQLWADPRQLERWWGPPTYPATMEEHDLAPGGGVSYFMTGPEGKKYHGWWRVIAVDPPRSLEFTDGFADEDGAPNPEMPITTSRMRLSEHEGGTRMELRWSFEAPEEMQRLLEMGALQGLREAVDQMGPLLAG